jgi:hypothetical protein
VPDQTAPELKNNSSPHAGADMVRSDGEIHVYEIPREALTKAKLNTSSQHQRLTVDRRWHEIQSVARMLYAKKQLTVGSETRARPVVQPGDQRRMRYILIGVRCYVSGMKNYSHFDETDRKTYARPTICLRPVSQISRTASGVKGLPSTI